MTVVKGEISSLVENEALGVLEVEKVDLLPLISSCQW